MKQIFIVLILIIIVLLAAGFLITYNRQKADNTAAAVSNAETEQQSLWDRIQASWDSATPNHCFSQIGLPENLMSPDCRPKASFNISSNSLLSGIF